MGSSVTFGQLWDLWEWSRREAEEAGVCQSPAYAQCLTHEWQGPLLAHACLI